MALEINEEHRRLLTPEDLENLREAIADFEAQAAEPKDPNGMRRDKTDFPIGIYDVEEPDVPNFDNPLR
jgi:hypothetical protein